MDPFCPEMYTEMIFTLYIFLFSSIYFLSVTTKVKSNQKFQNRRHLRSKLRNEALKPALSITG